MCLPSGLWRLPGDRRQVCGSQVGGWVFEVQVRGGRCAGGVGPQGSEMRASCVGLCLCVLSGRSPACFLPGPRRKQALSYLHRLLACVVGPRRLPAVGCRLAFGSGRVESWRDRAGSVPRCPLDGWGLRVQASLRPAARCVRCPSWRICERRHASRFREARGAGAGAGRAGVGRPGRPSSHAWGTPCCLQPHFAPPGLFPDPATLPKQLRR